MYFWKIERLKQDIRLGVLTEKNKMLYFLMTAILSLIFMNFASWAIMLSFVPAKRAMVSWDYVLIAMSFLVISLGILMSYRANGGEKGNDFLGRFVSISFVVWNRWAVFSALLSVIYLFLEFILYGEAKPDAPTQDPYVTTYLYVITYTGWAAFLYWRIFIHIKDLHKTSE